MKVLTQARRDAIVAAAAEVFLEIGYERASMDEVARRAGGSKATLYKYFSSKETLFETVVRNYSARFLTEAANGLTQPEYQHLTLEQKLTRFGEDMLRVVACDNQALQIYRVVLGEAGHSDIGQLFLESGIRQSMEALAQEMSAAMERGELAPANPMLRAIQFTTLVKAETEALFFLREMPNFSEEKVSEMVANGLRIFLNGAVTKTE
ncbi:TetR/AcrR family transcriptional regulator [Dickeya zeae]|jgi:AcrR family transcriptional regulator|uniref:TetR/AcrR family transcriptional regulator n=1 Tax=Dickeya zeae TaxID=204042 RepID=UPI0003A12744|nr:TetR/AcrR family transcriptional regulator [Dickeya zeae]